MVDVLVTIGFTALMVFGIALMAYLNKHYSEELKQIKELIDFLDPYTEIDEKFEEEWMKWRGYIENQGDPDQALQVFKILKQLRPELFE